jgi:multicomponent Na+:H+ antiporter subunit G
MELLGNIIMSLGIVFMVIGIIGITKYKNFYTRILLTTKIDTIGAITFIIGVAVKHGISFFSLKLLLLVGIMLVLEPLATHIIARSAYNCGYGEEK